MKDTVRDALEVLYKVSSILAKGLAEELKKNPAPKSASKDDEPHNKNWEDFNPLQQRAMRELVEKIISSHKEGSPKSKVPRDTDSTTELAGHTYMPPLPTSSSVNYTRNELDRSTEYNPDRFTIYSGEKLKALRQKHQLTVKELSILTGVSYSSCYKIENGKIMFRYINAVKVASTFGIDIKELEADPENNENIQARKLVYLPKHEYLEYYDKNRIICIRKSANMDQKELADRAGCSHSAISALEIGRVRITHEKATRIAKALQVDISELKLSKPKKFECQGIIDHGYSALLLKQYRQAKHMSAEELSIKAGFSRAVVSSIENLSISFTPQSAVKFAHTLGINVEKLENNNTVKKEN